MRNQEIRKIGQSGRQITTVNMNATIRDMREHLQRKEQKKTKQKSHQTPVENMKKNIKELLGGAKSTEIIKTARNDYKNRQNEIINKRNKRKDPEYLTKEKKAKKHKKDGNVENMISNFHNAVKTGPLYVCTVCLQTWYRESNQ